jgi:hypothetical protein
LAGSTSAIANAVTRSAIEGTSFGRNLVAAIPDVVANALVNFVSACLVGDTPVHTPRGLRRIDAIRVGDLVYAKAEDFGGGDERTLPLCGPPRAMAASQKLQLLAAGL